MRPIAPLLMQMRIIWFALMASCVIYIVVANAVQFDGEPGDTALLQKIFAGLSVAVAIALPILRRVMMPPTKAAANMREVSLEEIPTNIAARVFTTHILIWALAESVCIYGLVLTFLSQDPQVILPFAGAAILLQLFNGPRRSVLEGAARAAQQ